ncbi:MAG: ABC-2 transporter permease [Clostridium sp.]|uniref:ABC-2 transporter permease n=1 Tax=Clostridium sp. TaxID=1506 RepID=UPI0025BD29CB|nr:ABC-2 transporter permease [Clostridium sp.]MCH3963113.1 ABC-2 transporter permease [Clostridium sp.]MCI1716424.1 ABC-2 transporter permease [Clostridium sp.]MCI1800764.1 ABC-2 transporter permease [Clostridium sp.]MCI1814581.1 ABC-2 transporter permease [Clostridium sp.]MCI1871491.1 ABC-2 transporter permease [Clostridium sp.]
MINLILKDILIQKKTFIIIILVSLLTSINFKDDPSLMFAFISNFSAYALVTGTFYKDEKANVMLNSLPINRITIVMSKYISILIFGLLGILSAFILPNLMQSLYIIQLSGKMTLEYILGSFAGVLLLSCSVLPVYFKYGYAATRYAAIGLFLVIFFAFTTIGKIQNVKHITNYLGSLPDNIITAGIVITMFIIFLVSFFISYSIYKGKNF